MNDYQSLLSMTWKPTNRLLHLVRELLAYQQLKSGQLRIVGQPCRAVELVKQAAQLTPVKGKQVGVLLSVKPVFLSVWAAPHYTILLLAHLLSNAIKFSLPSLHRHSDDDTNRVGSNSVPVTVVGTPRF